MSQISIRGIRKSFGEHEILQAVSFDIEEYDRIGLVGVNGCGKSTLLNILLGRIEPDAGQIEFFSRPSVAMLDQAPMPGEELDRIRDNQSYGAFRQTLGLLGAAPEKENHPVEVLSGGEQMKLALSRLLAEKPELLLLDEPTNNLDLHGIDALIEQLSYYQGALLIVSHDRYFLDRVVTRVLELEEGKITEYLGGYTDYREEKARRYEEALHRYEAGQKEQERIDNAIHQVKNWAEKGHRESTKKADQSGVKMGLKEKFRTRAKKKDSQVKSQVKRLERLKRDSEERPREEKRVHFEVTGNGKHGKRILEAENLAKGFGNHPLFANSSFVMLRGEHVALFGPNGCGKSTFVRMLQGTEAADNGRLWLSPSSRPFVLEQNVRSLPKEITPLQYYTGLWGRLDGRQRVLLANMGLRADLLNRKIERLSLGEQMKVKLAELILSKEDFIVLDEPTNYLDLHAREMLEDTLAEYGGTLLLISHDVYFLERTCDKVLLFEDGQLQKLEMSFADYMERRE